MCRIIFNLAVSKIGVLDAVMQQAGTDRVSIQAHLNDDLGHSDRMDDIGFAVAALLAFVCLGRAFISGANLLTLAEGFCFCTRSIRNRSCFSSERS